MAGPVAGLLSLGVGSTPASPPPTGFTFVWVSDVDGLVYKMDDGGVVTTVGGTSLPNPIPLPTIGIIPFPPPGQVHLYAKTADRKMYSMDQFGVESGPFGAGGSSDPLPLASGAAPAAPGSGILVYSKVGFDKLFSKDQFNVETAYGAGGGGAVTPQVTGLWVDPNAAGPGTRGDLNDPFTTVQAAITAAVDGDTIFLSSNIHLQFGTFAFGGKTDLLIKGPGSATCAIVQTFIGSLFVPPPAMVFFGLVGMTLVGNNQAVLNGIGTGSVGNYLSNGCFLHDVQAINTTGMFLQHAGALSISDVRVEGNCSLLTCSCFGDLTRNLTPVKNLTVTGTLRLSWDESDVDRPGLARPFVPMQFQNVRSGGICYLRNEPSVQFDAACAFQELTTDFGLTAQGALAPRVVFRGTLDTFCNFINVAGFPDTANPQLWNFDGCTILGSDGGGNSLYVEVAPGGAPAVNRVLVRCKEAKLTAGATVFSSWGVDADIRGCGMNVVGSSGLSDGTVHQDFYVFSALPNGACPVGGFLIGFQPSLAPPKQVQVQVTTFLGVSAITNLWVDESTFTSTNFKVNYTGVAVFGVDQISFTVIWR